MPLDHLLLDGTGCDALLTQREEILELADSLISQLPAQTSGIIDAAAAMVDDLRIHRSACAMAAELLAAHDTDSLSDELPRLYAEQLLCYHLRELANLTEF